MPARSLKLTRWGTVVAAIVLLTGVWGLWEGAQPAAAQADPAELLQQGIDAFNRGDVDAVMEIFADDAVLTGITPCVPVECVGKSAIRNAVEFYVADNIRITITSAEVSGNTATGSAEIESDMIHAAGVERFVSTYSAEVQGDNISRQRFDFDTGDAQTADFLSYVGVNTVSIAMGPGRDGDQTPGWTDLIGFGDRTAVAVSFVAPGPAGVRQPVNIHEGTCADLGAVAYSLQDVSGGISAIVLDVPLSELRAANLAINVAESYDKPETYVACGEIAAVGAVERPAPEIPVAGSGGLVGGGGGRLTTWAYALAASGILLAAGGFAGVLALRGRSRD
jgi:hypothetical protein